MKPMTMAQWYREKGSQHWDFVDEFLRAHFEIKIGSDNHTLRLFCDQLVAQKQELVFPVEDGYLFFFVYRNRNTTGRRKKSLLGHAGRSWSTLSKFLGRSVSAAYLVDMRLVHSIWDRDGSYPWRNDLFSDRDVVRLCRTELKDVATDMRQGLANLGFSPEELSQWLPPNAKRSRPRIIETTFLDQRVSFPLFIITPNGFKNRVLHRLNGTVKK
jgi:hypothetical protein